MEASSSAARRLLRSTEHWNHNTHYHRLIPRVTEPPWSSVLDVGCGEGLLTRRLAPAAERVLGIDPDETALAEARRLAPAGVEYVAGDVLMTDVGGPFDLVTCFATLHHLDLRAGLVRLRELTAPGGTLVVVGLANPGSVRDLPLGAAGLVATRVARWRRGHWEPLVALCEPTTTYDDVRTAARELVPGAVVRQRLYWRYSLVWRRPGD